MSYLVDELRRVEILNTDPRLGTLLGDMVNEIIALKDKVAQLEDKTAELEAECADGQ